MNRERLLLVAKACRETKHAAEFDMDRYGHPCGTPACALGNYCARPDLQSEFGLVVTMSGAGRPWALLRLTATGEAIGHAHDAVLNHFDIDEFQADLLFSGDDVQDDDGDLIEGNQAETPIQAAEWIEAFVARGGTGELK